MKPHLALYCALCLLILLPTGAGDTGVEPRNSRRKKKKSLSVRTEKRKRRKRAKRLKRKVAAWSVNDWGRYRLGDIVKNYISVARNRSVRERVLVRWPDSIAAEYLRQTDAKDDFEVLCEIVRERSSEEEEEEEEDGSGEGRGAEEAMRRLPESTAVLHLRLADVCDWEHRARQWWFGSKEAGAEEGGYSPCETSYSYLSLIHTRMSHTHAILIHPALLQDLGASGRGSITKTR